MRLLSAAVRNYRIHRELAIEFDPARTLIGGPNESGKSTLIEAIHRGLFLKSTVTGEGRRSMASNLSPGHPEVEVRFTAGGGEYNLTKRFSGASGTTRLVRAGGRTWRGEEAETKLAGLLGVEEPGGGRGILERVGKRWSHLWVWQGRSGEDPSKHTASQQAHLLRQLQRTGGAVAMQSELDARVASRFAQAKERIFLKTGRPKRGSDLDDAQTEAQKAEKERDDAKEKFERLQQAVEDFERASTVIQRATKDLEDLQRKRQNVDEKMTRAEELQRAEKEQESAVDEAVEKRTALEGIEKNIEELRKSIDDLRKSLEPKRKEESRLESALSDGRKRTAEAEREYDEALEKTREVRLRRELAAACVNRFEKEDRNNELQVRLERVRELEEKITGFRERLAQLPSIDQEKLREWQDLENESTRAAAAFDAMAAEVEVVSADEPVRVGDAELSTGESRTVTEPTDVKAGDSLILRIHPGGGEGLAGAREEVRRLSGDLRRSLDEHGLGSIAEASEVVARRTDLKSGMDNAEAAFKELDAEGLKEACISAANELAAARAEVKRRREQVADAKQPSTPAKARSWRDREEDVLRAMESGETSLKTTCDTLRQKQEELDDELRSLREAIAEENRNLTGFEAQLKMLLDNHGDDETRAGKIEEARLAEKKAVALLEKTRGALDILQPGILEADRERLQRAIEEMEKQRQDARTARAVSQTALRLDGTVDPKAALARAEAGLAAAAEHLDSVRRKAEAVSLIDTLFGEEQRALADRFSQPLARKISGYFQCLFGTDARAVVTFEDNAFKGIELVRSDHGGAVSFESLSGGTREQVAAAVRLAIAELLAADHDDSLPVVFDDAFAYSDPERIDTLQRMLDLGAARGLQIIVLTCNPSDYAALGAHQIILEAVTLREPPSAGVPPPDVTGNAGGSQTAAAGPSKDPASVTDRDCEAFMAALSDLGGRSGNKFLREKLSWDEVKYAAVKDRLVSESRIVPGKGCGGSVALKE